MERAWTMMASLTLMTAMAAAAVEPAATDAALARRYAVLAFADDGTRALVLQTSGSTVLTEVVLVVDHEGVQETLPLGHRVPGGMLRADDIALCTRSAERLAALARDFHLVSVRIGLCGHPDRPVVDVLEPPRPAVMRKEIGVLHQQVGFPGRTFLPDRGPLVVVIGSDGLGNDRLGLARR